MRLINADNILKINFENKNITLTRSENLDQQVYIYSILFADSEELIRAVPTEDAKLIVHGEWIDKNDKLLCSVCMRGDKTFSYFNFCPFCGADMRFISEREKQHEQGMV